MQTCGVCNTSSGDTVRVCPTCGSDLDRESLTSRALAKLQANPRVTLLYLTVNDDCCPACRQAYGAYPKDKAPRLPVEGCSHPMGCRCFYQPALSAIYP